MPAKPARRKAVLTATDAEYFSDQIPSFLKWLKEDGISGTKFKDLIGPVKHFLVWLDCREIDHSAVDGSVVRHFLRHKCDCPRPKGAKYQTSAARKPTFKASVLNFVAFLEASGAVKRPFDPRAMSEAISVFTDELRGHGAAESSVEGYANACRHFLAWCSIERVPLEGLSEDDVAAFARHDCVCRQLFVQGDRRSPNYLNQVRRFVRHLRGRRIIPPTGPERADARSKRLAAFRVWLGRHRGCSNTTIDGHVYRLERLLPHLGDDPTSYTTASLQRIIVSQLKGQSRASVKGMTTTLRMYLRFLATEEGGDASLIGAIPNVPHWKLSTLPKYILADDVERVIEACDVTTPKGLRDRAIILLLARLALRRGDILHLRLQDIDWDNAIIRVSGKSKRWTGLPLPQDVGDALADYIEHGRPYVDEESVFLRSIKPFKPFASGGPITIIAREALQRAGINNANLGGAYLFRHSAATNLLRAGSSLEEVSTLLRHKSAETTKIYAKVDTTMLGSVVQPWIGGES